MANYLLNKSKARELLKNRLQELYEKDFFCDCHQSHIKKEIESVIDEGVPLYSGDMADTILYILYRNDITVKEMVDERMEETGCGCVHEVFPLVMPAKELVTELYFLVRSSFPENNFTQLGEGLYIFDSK